MSLLDNCDITQKENLGVTKCKTLPQLPKGMITTPLNFVIPVATIEAGAAAIKEYLQTALESGIATRIFYWPKFVGFENASEEAIYEESALADLVVRDGKYRFRFQIKESLCLHKKMYTHRGGEQRVFLFDIENQLFGTQLSNGDFAGFTVSLLNTEKLMISDGTVSTKTPVYLVLSDNKEIDANGGLIAASFVNELARLTDVELAIVGSPLAGSFQVSVKVACDGTPVSGLVLADFVVTETDGDLQAPTAVTEPAGDGIYTLTKVSFVDGFVNLRAASLLSISAYESEGPVALNIP